MFQKIKLINHNLVINYSILGYALSLSISKAGTVFFSLLMILFWLFEGNFKEKFKELGKNKFIIALLSLMILSLIYALLPNSNEMALKFVKKYWHFIPILVIFTSIKPKFITYAINYFLIGIVISIIFSFGIYFEIITFKNVLPSYPSPFMDHMNYSTYLSLASLLVLNKIFFINDLKTKVLYITLFLIVLSCLFINGGRTGQVIFIITLFLFTLFSSKNKIKTFILISISVILLTSLAYIVSPNFKNRTNHTIRDIHSIVYDNNYRESFGQRLSLWIIGSHIFKDNFLLGTGIGNERNTFNFYATKLDFSYYQRDNFKGNGSIDFHSSFVQYAVQLGIFGLILFLSIFYFLMKQKFNEKVFRNTNIIFITVFFLHSTVFFSFHLIHPMVLFALFAPLLAKASFLDQEKV